MARPNKPWFRKAKNAWYATVDGIKVSLKVKGEENEAEALKAWHRLMADGKPVPVEQALTVKEVVGAFLEDVATRVKPATARWYQDLLTPFAARFGNVKADRLNLNQVNAYAQKPEWSNSTRNGFLSALSIAFRCGGHPLVGLKKPPMESRGDKALVSKEAHKKLLKVAPPYFKPFLLLMHLTGARPGEVAAITAENFDEGNAMVRLKEHKTARHGKSRVVFLPDEAVALLKGLKEKNGSGHLLRGRYGNPLTKNAIVHLMARLRKKAGVKGTAYGYRHGFATDALAKGVPDAQVAALLGHSGTTMLHRHYSHLTERAQVLRDALGKVR